MAEVLLVSKAGDGYSIATKLSREGHTVDVYIRDPYYKITGKGSTNPRTVPKLLSGSRPNLILFDMVGLGVTADKLVQGGGVVLGGGVVQDTLYFSQLFREKLISLTPMKMSLENLPKGIELLIGGWFNGDKWIPPFTHSITWDRLAEGDKGPKVGFMGGILWVSLENKAIRNSLLALTEFLEKSNYIGPIQIKCLLTEEDIYFLSLYSNFHYDTFQALCELLKGDLYSFLFNIAIGSQQQSIFSSKYSISIRLLIPGEVVQLANLKAFEVPIPAENHIWLSDSIYKDNIPLLSGIKNTLGCVTAWGEDPREARRRVYRTISNMNLIKDIHYRMDIGKDFEEKEAQLKTWGWVE